MDTVDRLGLESTPWQRRRRRPGHQRARGDDGGHGAGRRTEGQLRRGQGTTYQLYLGGASTGTVKDGVFSGGVYYGGSRRAEFTVSETVTVVRAS